MSVRAKMRCTGRREWSSLNEEGLLEGVEVTLQPVFAGKDDKANAVWSKWTPSGEVKMVITNPDAFKQFEIGKAYFVDFTPAEP